MKNQSSLATDPGGFVAAMFCFAASTQRDEEIPIPPPARSGVIPVNLVYTGKSKPIPGDDPRG